MPIEKTEYNNKQDVKGKILSDFLYCLPNNNDCFHQMKDIDLDKKPSDSLTNPNGISDFFRILSWNYEIDLEFGSHKTFAEIIDHCKKNPKEEKSKSVALQLIHSLQKKVHKLLCF